MNFNYQCDVCGHEYKESRDPELSQFIVNCPVAGCLGKLVEVA